MDEVRYYAALLLLMTAPGGTLYWVSIHPFIRLWRKIGPAGTLTVHFSFMAVLACLVVLIRHPLLSVQFETQPVLVAASALLMAVSVVLRVRISKHLTKKILMGIPEIAPERNSPLLTQGPFARVRNPRYLQVLMAMLAWALFANYLAGYVVFAASIVILRTVIWMEEKELRARYGAAYDDYCARVPRIIPKLHREESR